MKLSEKARDVIKVVAPGLGAALGGPLGGLAGQILGGLVSGNDPAGLEKVIIEQKPETLLALRKADQEFALKLKELDLEPEKIAQADRADARDRETKTGDHLTPRVLASVIVGGFLLLVWYVMSGEVTMLKDPTAAGIIGTLIGYVSAKADQVVSYYFGSTASSRQKNEMLLRSKPAD